LFRELIYLVNLDRGPGNYFLHSMEKRQLAQVLSLCCQNSRRVAEVHMAHQGGAEKLNLGNYIRFVANWAVYRWCRLPDLQFYSLGDLILIWADCGGPGWLLEKICSIKRLSKIIKLSLQTDFR
jgi:hypothetical protein